MPVPQNVKTYLARKRIAADALEHRVVYTAYDLAQTTRTDLASIAKTLLVKANGTLVIAVVPANKHVLLPKVAAAVHQKKASIASEQDMAKRLKIKPGALTPFGGLYGLPVVIDKVILKPTRIVVGSGSFTDSLTMKPKDLVRAEEAIVAAISVSPPTPYKIQTKPKRAAKRPKKRPSRRPARRPAAGSGK